MYSQTNPGVKKYVGEGVYYLSNSKILTKPSVMVIIHQISLEISARSLFYDHDVKGSPYQNYP